jgi:futalosine hydrolase
MSFKILYVSATFAETDILKNLPGIRSTDDGYRFNNCEIITLITGVGSMATAWALKQWFSSNVMPDIVLNAGIAGSYRKELNTGDVVIPVSDCFADAGIEYRNDFLTLSEAGLCDPEMFPFKNGRIMCSNRFSDMAVRYLIPVNAITVNTATGSEMTIKKLQRKFNPDIETMEGATFFYICAMEKAPFLAIRAISNMVEPRDKSKWNISLALNNLSEKLKDLLLKLE